VRVRAPVACRGPPEQSVHLMERLAEGYDNRDEDEDEERREARYMRGRDCMGCD